tara:strand:- start:1292 stop:1522 length:231 start_codon:yes stop_codon:yes gene_type:complete
MISDDKKFNSWVKECNSLLIKSIGVGIDDMPDAMWADYFEGENTPAQALELAFDESWAGDPLYGSDHVEDAIRAIQ